jgi:hypothetical protein
MLNTPPESPRGTETITITHPFHPERGNEFYYLGRELTNSGDRVSCRDKQGNLRIFPVSYTNLHPFHEKTVQDGYAVSVDDLLRLKEELDSITEPRHV